MEEIGTLGSKRIDTPMDPNIHFDQNLWESLIDPEKYKRLIGILIYLIVIRTNITFIMGVLSQYMQSLYRLHWTGVCRILWYLKRAPGKELYLIF